jgi:hypothetical protein
VCIIHLCSVLTTSPALFLHAFFLRISLCSLFMCTPNYLFGGLLVVATSFPPDLATRCVKNWRNLSLEIRTMCQSQYILYVYTHTLYLVSDLEVSDNGDPLYGIIYCRYL